MPTYLALMLLIPLFYALGKGADILVENAQNISKKLGLPLFVVGLILGLMTSMPEITVSINSLVSGVPNLSVGNIVGGVLVIICCILGISAIVNRSIHTDGKLRNVLPLAGYLLAGILAGMDGRYQLYDGIILFCLYPAMMYLLYRNQRSLPDLRLMFIRESKIMIDLVKIIAGIAVVILASHVIVDITVELLHRFDIPPFVIGVLVFSIGTNLPELIITIKSWRKRAGDLSISHLLGSAATNIWILGGIALWTPVSVVPRNSFFLAAGVIVVTLVLIVVFYRTGKKFSRLEGMILLGVYALFLIGQLTLGATYLP